MVVPFSAQGAPRLDFSLLFGRQMLTLHQINLDCLHIDILSRNKYPDSSRLGAVEQS